MSHEQATADLRVRIGQTSAMQWQIQTQHGEITNGAAERLEQVLQRLEQLRPQVVLDHSAADEYLDLTKEKGALLRTLALP